MSPGSALWRFYLLQPRCVLQPPRQRRIQARWATHLPASKPWVPSVMTISDDQSRRDYWAQQMELGQDLIQQVLPFEVHECGEGFASIPEAAKAAEVEMLFSDSKIAGELVRVFFVREGLVNSLMAIGRALNDRGWILKIEDGYRSMEMQSQLVRKPELFDAILRKCIWENGGELPATELVFRRATVLIANIPKIGTHGFRGYEACRGNTAGVRNHEQTVCRWITNVFSAVKVSRSKSTERVGTVWFEVFSGHLKNDLCAVARGVPGTREDATVKVFFADEVFGALDKADIFAKHRSSSVREISVLRLCGVIRLQRHYRDHIPWPTGKLKTLVQNPFVFGYENLLLRAE